MLPTKVGFLGPEQSHLTCVRYKFQVCHYLPRGKIPQALLYSCMFPSDVCKPNKQVRFFSCWDLIESMREKVLDEFLPHNVRHSLGCSAQLLMKNNYTQKVILVLVSLTTTWKHTLGQGISLLEAASGNCLPWDGINLSSQISTLFP